MSDLVSIVVPVYNAGKYLSTCIESILNQDYVNLELLLINDGSLDDSRHICDAYKKQDSRVRVVHRENQGVASTRNQGIFLAEGKYMMFVDADDWIESTTVSELLTIMEAKNADIVECSYRFVHPYKKVDVNNNRNIHEICGTENIFKASIESCDESLYKVCWGKLYRTALCKQVKFPKRTIAEDAAFCDNLFMLCEKVVKYNAVLYNYRMTDNSIMRSKISKTVFESFDTALEMKTLLEKSRIKFSDDFIKEVELFVSNVPVSILETIIEQGVNPRNVDGFSDFLNKVQLYKDSISINVICNGDIYPICEDSDRWIDERFKTLRFRILACRIKKVLQLIVNKIFVFLNERK